MGQLKETKVNGPLLLDQTGGGNFVNIIDLIHPIGSVIQLNSETDPNAIYEGTTWERIKGKVLVGVDEDDVTFASAGLEGGEKEHKLVEKELPVIDGNMQLHGQEYGSIVYNVTGHYYGTKVNDKYKTGNQASGAYSLSGVGYKFGGNDSHNNLQPYKTVYIWERTA